MKKILLFILLFSHFKLEAQECMTQFIENITNVFNEKSKKLNEKTIKSTLGIYNEQLEIINVPVIFVSKEGAKLYRNRLVEKDKILCYLNTRKLQFDESFIYSDTIVKGVVGRFTTYNGIKYEFHKDTTSYVSFRLALINKIRAIAPDFIFRVYNISSCYWYVKNNQLYVLYFKHKELKIDSIETMQASDFISDYLNKDDLVFLYHKRVEVVSGK